MKERPILFSAPMVRAILSGAKTQTRRAIRDQSMVAVMDGAVHLWTGFMGWQPFDAIQADPGLACKAAHCPYGWPGDRLVVRETWQYADWTEDGYPFIRYRADDAKVLHERIPSDEWAERLQEIWIDLSSPANFDIDNTAADRRWRPAIHMPRWACRLLPAVASVRIERLQDINEDDARAEGVLEWGRGALSPDGQQADPSDQFRWLWDSINGAGPANWSANPWVWVVEFRRVEATAKSSTAVLEAA